MTDSKKPSDDTLSADDLWAEAMNEQVGSATTASQSDDVFKSFETSNASSTLR